MAQLPADRTKLALAQGNQTPTLVAASAKNINAITEIYDTTDLLNQKVDTHAGAAVLPHADGSVTLAKMAANSVGTTQLVDGSITAAKVADGVLTAAKFVAGVLNNETQNGLLIAALSADITQRGVNVCSAPYNADKTGITDSSVAIQAAIDSGASYIFFPIGSYLINTSLNITNRSDSPLTLVGAGWSEYGGTGTTKLIGNTGGIVIDTTGSQFITIEDLLIYSDNTTSTPSTIGILVARSSTSLYAQFHNYKRLFIYLVSSPTATAKGSIGILNITGEHMNYDHGFIIADLPLALMSSNVLGVTSPFTTFGAIASMTLCSFKEVGMRALTQSAMELWSCQNITFDKCYWSNVPANTTVQAILFDGNCSDIKIDGQIEEFGRALQISADATNIVVDVFVNTMTTSYVFLYNGIKLYNPSFSVHQASGTQQQMFSVGDASVIIYGGEIILQPNQALVSTTLTVLGVNVIACNVANTEISLDSSSKYSINGSDVDSYQSGTSGYIRLLNGHTIQWMKKTVTGADTDNTFTFPIAFTTSCDNVTLTPVGASSVTATENGRSTTDVTIRCSVTLTDVYIFAVGH